MGINKGVIFMPDMRQLVIKDMYCTDVYKFIGTLLDLEQLLLYVEGFQHLVIFILGLTFPKHLDDLVVTRKSVREFCILDYILIKK